MNDQNLPPAGVGADDDFRPPFLLALFQRPRDGVRSAMAEAAAADPDGDRARVLANLMSKYFKLDDTSAALQGVLNTTADEGEYDRAAVRLAEARAEQSMCKARYDAVDAGRPFSDPGEAAEDALLTAMRAVERAAANTAAVAALLGAAHGLIEAYRARSTEAA